MRGTSSRIGLTFIFFIASAVFYFPRGYAQNADRLVALSKEIMDAKDAGALFTSFEALKDLYIHENKYSEFVEFLNSLGRKKKNLELYVNYYTAYARYSQLRHLEDKQLWDEYFSQGNAYRDQIAYGAKEALNATQPRDRIHVEAGLLLWKFHKDQQDSSADDNLDDLMKSIALYAGENADIKPIKEAADTLASYGERGKSRELYKLYVNKILTSNITTGELKTIAVNFYNENNLDLSESVYDAYIERLGPSKAALMPVLREIALQFSYKKNGAGDVVYAEQIFKRMETLGGADALDEELLYHRADNALRSGDYVNAKGFYVDFTKRFPRSLHADECVFKTAMIDVYMLKNPGEGRASFKKLAGREGALTSWGIQSLYQLGLLSQWENDSATAQGFYDEGLKKGVAFPETTELIRRRKQEINDKASIEHNLKMFLDASFSKEPGVSAAENVELACTPARTPIHEKVEVGTTASVGATGCFAVEMHYLWSGHLGTAQPGSDEASFATAYNEPGTKEINLVVVSSTGVVGHTLDFVDVE